MSNFLEIDKINNLKILLSPLDWGFGHTTRCVSLIKELISNSNSITFAGNELQNEFIKNEFPNIDTIENEGYNIQLNSNKSTYIQIVKQSIKFSNSIKSELKFVDEITKNKSFDLIISDNRYGFRSNNIKSVLISHQLSPQVPFGKLLIKKLIHFYTNKFNECWIPDDPKINLSGKLSNHNLKIPTYFIGLLNRFSFKPEKTKKYKITILASGPEPSKTIFINHVLEELTYLPFDFCLVSNTAIQNLPNNVYHSINPSTKSLELIINQSESVIGRNGYTTLMEFHNSLINRVLIPTPNQFEQEYLAKHLNLVYHRLIKKSISCLIYNKKEYI